MQFIPSFTEVPVEGPAAHQLLPGPTGSSSSAPHLRPPLLRIHLLGCELKRPDHDKQLLLPKRLYVKVTIDGFKQWARSEATPTRTYTAKSRPSRKGARDAAGVGGEAPDQVRRVR